MLPINKQILTKSGAAIALLVGLYQLHDSIYESGIEACQNEASRVFNEKVLALQADTVKQVESALKLQSVDHAKDIERAKTDEDGLERVVILGYN